MKPAGGFFENAANRATKCTDIGDFIGEFCNEGLISNATFHMVTNTNNSLAIPFVKTTYPPDWVNYYLLNNLMSIDPIVRRALDAELPFFWADVALSHAEKQMMSEARDHGLSSIGYTVPTFDVGPYRGLFSIVSEIDADEDDWRRTILTHAEEIERIANSLHGVARLEIDPYDGYSVNLSKREIECLVHIAAGKTHTDLAAILGLSEHTVRSYCRTLRLKLNCSTLAQAVAKACSMGII